MISFTKLCPKLKLIDRDHKPAKFDLILNMNDYPTVTDLLDSALNLNSNLE